MCLIFLDVSLVCHTFPSDSAQNELFEVSFSVGNKDWETNKHNSFSGRGKGHRFLFFQVLVALAGS